MAGIRLTRFSALFGLAIVSLEAVVRGPLAEATKTLLTLLVQTRIEGVGRGRYKCRLWDVCTWNVLDDASESCSPVGRIEMD